MKHHPAASFASSGYAQQACAGSSSSPHQILKADEIYTAYINKNTDEIWIHRETGHVERFINGHNFRKMVCFHTISAFQPSDRESSEICYTIKIR